MQWIERKTPVAFFLLPHLQFALYFCQEVFLQYDHLIDTDFVIINSVFKIISAFDVFQDFCNWINIQVRWVSVVLCRRYRWYCQESATGDNTLLTGQHWYFWLCFWNWNACVLKDFYLLNEKSVYI